MRLIVPTFCVVMQPVTLRVTDLERTPADPTPPIVPTLCVVMQPVTLCVTDLK